MSADSAKQAAAHAALAYLVPGTVLGVGTGSTVNFFIDALAAHRASIPGAVSSSEASSRRLAAVGIPVLEANLAGPLSLYVDGADESDHGLHLIKGGGGAHTREKIVAELAERFVCIADESKLVRTLGRFPLPVEVIPMAVGLVSAKLVALGGRVVPRAGLVTDNGNPILDVHGLAIADPVGLEAQLNQVPGVVTVGLFARRKADVLLLGSATQGAGVRTVLAVP